MSNKMPKRDDRVNEGKKDRQGKLEKEGVKEPESYPEVPGAKKISNPDNPAAGIPGRGK